MLKVNTSEIPDGFYRAIIGTTIYVFCVSTHPIDQSTLKKWKVSGRQEISIAVNDARTWKGFGYIEENHVRQFRMWRDPKVNEGILAAVDALFHNPEHAAREYAHAFGKCYVCNRKLTDKDSLETGIGPDCAGTRKHVEVEQH